MTQAPYSAMRNTLGIASRRSRAMRLRGVGCAYCEGMLTINDCKRYMVAGLASEIARQVILVHRANMKSKGPDAEIEEAFEQVENALDKAMDARPDSRTNEVCAMIEQAIEEAIEEARLSL